MWVLDRKVLNLKCPPCFHEVKDLARHVPPGSKGAKGMPWAEVGGGGCVGSITHSVPFLFGGGGGGHKRFAPLFPGPQR